MRLYTIATAVFKSETYRFLRLDRPTAEEFAEGKDFPPGYIHLPMWLGPEYFDELTIETRTEKGWVKPSGARNEAFDLHVYNRAAVIALRAEAINWDDPPDWAKPPSGHPTPPQAAQGEKAEDGDRDQPSPPPGIVWRRSTYWDGDE